MAVDSGSSKNTSSAITTIIVVGLVVGVVIVAIAVLPSLAGTDAWKAIVGLPSMLGLLDANSFAPGNPFQLFPNQEEIFRLPDNPFEQENPF